MIRTGGHGIFMWFLLGLFLRAGFPGPAHAGFQGEVLAGSTGNIIPVRIENISKQQPIKKIVIQLTAHSPELKQITFSPQTLDNIPPGGIGTFKVSFAVDKSAKPDTMASMKFLLSAQRGAFETSAPTLTVKIKSTDGKTPLATAKCGDIEKALVLVAVEWSSPGSLPKGVSVHHSGDQPGYSYQKKAELARGLHVYRWSGGFTQFPKRIHLGSPFKIGGEARYSQKDPTAFCSRKAGKSMFTTPVPPAKVFVAFAGQGGHFTGQLPGELPCKGGDFQKGNWSKAAGMKFGISAIPVKESGSEFHKQYHYKHVASVGSGGETWGKNGTFVIKWENAGTADKPKPSSDRFYVLLRRPGDPRHGSIRLVYQAPTEDQTCLDNVVAYKHPDEMGVTGADNEETPSVASLPRNAEPSKAETSSITEQKKRKAEGRLRQAVEWRRKVLEDSGQVSRRKKSPPAKTTVQKPEPATKKLAPHAKIRIRPDSSIEIVMNDPVEESPPNSQSTVSRQTKTNSVSGDFSTPLGTITFHRSGPPAAEYNPKQRGRFLGTYSGNVFSGHWVSKTSGKRCSTKKDGSKHWGKIRLVFDAELNAFDGKWGHCGDELKWEWNGKRIGAEQIKNKTYSVSGDFSSPLGTITFHRSGPPAAEYNPKQKGRFLGTYSGNVFSGHWVSKTSGKRCSTKKDGSLHWGNIRLVFDASFNEFKGKWGHCGGEVKWQWNGKRIGGQ